MTYNYRDILAHIVGLMVRYDLTDGQAEKALNIAKQLSSLCESEKGEVNLAKLHALLGLFNYSIQYATITEFTKRTHHLDDDKGEGLYKNVKENSKSKAIESVPAGSKKERVCH